MIQYIDEKYQIYLYLPRNRSYKIRGLIPLSKAHTNEFHICRHYEGHVWSLNFTGQVINKDNIFFKLLKLSIFRITKD